ncbi:DinB family protein [Aurantibacillus circumpalustris]|uniref:DinB family protein n=1 Tax=Aurantibacillus circumpalustris TaxID=3036359 RepID=UPI00295A81BF|nr:DinB family protein [Aurantibacillus circumpalustris]
MNKQTNAAEGNHSDQIIKQIVAIWASRNKAFSDFFNKYPNEEYLKSIAPGKNRSVYLLGHLIAVNDGMIPLFGLGERLFPELEDFVSKPDNTFEIEVTMNELKSKWEKLNVTLSDFFNKMTTADWMDRHTTVSVEEFSKEPHRNKLNVLLGRTNHQSYHLGQLNFLVAKEAIHHN